MRQLCTAVVLLLAACGGESGQEVTEETEEPGLQVPLCEGELEPLPTDCQRLVYVPAGGYCNRWVDCDELQLLD